MYDTREIELENIGKVTLYRHRRASRIKITVRTSGDIRVTIPWHTSFQSGEQFLLEKKKWVESTLARIVRRTGSSRYIQKGDLFSTRNFLYRIEEATVSRVRISYSQAEKIVRFQYPAGSDINDPEIQAGLKKTVEGVLRFEARRFLPLRTAEIAAGLGYKVNGVTVKNNKTNWGSCSGLKNINLNLHLMRLPDRVIDYIITHELVHTVIPNHGPEFKKAMNRYFPDIREMEKQIKKVKIGSF